MPVGVKLVGGDFCAFGVEVGDDQAAGRVGPFAIFVDATEGADGANDFVARGFDDAGLFHEEAQGESRVVGAFFEEAQGVSMAVNHGAVAEFEFAGQFAGASPVEKSLLDGVAVRVVADGAFDLVIFEAGFVAAGRVLRLAFRVWGFGVELGWFRIGSVWRHCRFLPVSLFLGTGTRPPLLLLDLCSHKNGQR